jgi:hypothetical protein
MSIGGKQQGVSKKDLLKLAAQFNIIKATEILEEVEYTVANWKSYAQHLEIDSEVSNIIETSITVARKRK